MHLNRYSALLLFPLILSILFFVYSYFWIDHGLITFLASDKSYINIFFQMISTTNNNKVLISQGYVLLIILFFACQIIFFIPRVYKSLPLKSTFIILGIISFIFALSYNFLSKDIYSYYLFAKMAYYYHLNPFNTAPEVLAGRDFFVLIAHNLNFPYRYGPLFLLYSIIPLAILTIQKIILYFFVFKILNGIIFLLSGLLIFRIANNDRRVFAIWFLNPYLLIELLSNSHNEIVMVAPALIGIYFLHKKQIFKSSLFIVCSFLIKYVSLITLPLFVLNEKWKTHYFKIIGLTMPIFIYFTGFTIQPWYLSWSYMLLPFAKLKNISWIFFFIIGFISIANYFRFLESSGWGAGSIIPYPLFITILLLAIIICIEYDLLRIVSIKIRPSRNHLHPKI